MVWDKKNMAKLMAGFIQICKIILSMLKYEVSK